MSIMIQTRLIEGPSNLISIYSDSLASSVTSLTTPSQYALFLTIAWWNEIGS